MTKTCPGNIAAAVTGPLDESLAARLRQAIQGCSQHIHGPVQAWAEIEAAQESGLVSAREIVRLASDACSRRIADLLENGVPNSDPRIRKEELTRAFIEKLLGGGE
jgi:hypothetical protein